MTGCYTYFPVANNDLSNINTTNRLKIILNDKKEIIVENKNYIDYSDTNSIVALNSDHTKVTFSVLEISNLLEERFDFGKTLLSTFWMAGITLVVLYFIFVLPFSSGLS